MRQVDGHGMSSGTVLEDPILLMMAPFMNKR